MRWKKHRKWRRGGSPLWMKEKDRNARPIFLNEVKGKTLEEPIQIDMSAGQKEKDHFPSMVNDMNKSLRNAGGMRIRATSSAAAEETESNDLEAYVKSLLPGGVAAARLWGTGRRKCAVASVVLVDSTGKIILDDYLQGNPCWLQAIKYSIVRSHGGGLSGQAQAIQAIQASRDPLSFTVSRNV
ncbi:unnamed protein product [Calypogeia fissa]